MVFTLWVCRGLYSFLHRNSVFIPWEKLILKLLLANLVRLLQYLSAGVSGQFQFNAMAGV